MATKGGGAPLFILGILGLRSREAASLSEARASSE